MENEVKVYDQCKEQVLFQCSMNELEKAYDYIRKMEELGIETILDTPSLPQSLANSLGVSNQEIEDLKQEIIDEVDSHDSCCFED
mgnify:CR=1 FL=1